MSKRQAKSQASSARAASSAFGAPSLSAFGASSSQLSYVAEPPDLSALSDPNVVVYFRNLSKKDGTTKAKALEDLISHLGSLQEPVEEGLLEAWIKTYPRASIDNAKAVRQSAHAFQGQLAAAAGKRFAKYMPASVGAWLCGLYDGDRSVVEATQHSLRQVFTTPEKIQNIRKAYQQPILSYCRDAIDKESALTLSDERTTSPDDAEAKYSRVISACIALLGSLIANLQPEELSKFQSDYESLLNDRTLWDFASHGDASIRRSIHRFLKTCITKWPDALQTSLDTISKSYLSNALNSEQIGSAIDYIDALVLLTKEHSIVWTDNYKSKTSAQRRLRQFLKKGSQFGPRGFWQCLVDLFKVLPKDILPKDAADAAELLSSLHAGVSSKDESRLSLASAWGAYLDIAAFISHSLPEHDQHKLLHELVLPIITQYLRPTVENTSWNIPQDTTVLSKAISLDILPTILREKWPFFTQQLTNDIKTSAPEQSKDYETSQNSLIQQAGRFAIFQEQALRTGLSNSLYSVFRETSASVVSEALNAVESRNGKPYGAAGAVAKFLHHIRDVVLSSQETSQQLDSFITTDLPRLILSPSSSYLVDILYTLSDSPSFKAAWTSSLKAIVTAADSPSKSTALVYFLTTKRIPKSFNLATKDLELQAYIKSTVKAAIEGLLEWDSFNHILQSPAKILSSDTTDEILSYMAESLSLTQKAPYAIQGLRQIVRLNPSILKEFLSTSQGSSLLQSLLLASESPDEEVSQAAAAVNASLRTVLAAESDTKQSVYDLIQQGLKDANQGSVSVETLVELAKQLVKPDSPWEEIVGVFPGMEAWSSALAPFLSAAPKSSLAITNPLAGAVYLVETKETFTQARQIPRDADGYSDAYRIAQYITRILKDEEYFPMEKIPPELRHSLLCNTALTIHLAADNLGLAGANGLWAEYNSDVEADAIAYLSDSQSLIKGALKRLQASWSHSNADNPLLTWATELLSNVDPDPTAQAYYFARAYSVLVVDAIELCGWKNSQTAQLQDILKVVQRSREIFPLTSFVNAFNEPLAASKSCERMCNELVADLTGRDPKRNPKETLRQLVLLNILLHVYEEIAESIAKQRLIFFIKHVIKWLYDTANTLALRSEVCRSLVVLLPSIGDMNGEHWGQIMNILADSWNGTQELGENESGMDSPIPFVHASLKLYAKIRSLAQSDDSNDDLVYVWKDTEQAIANGLVNLLKHAQHFPDEFHQPLKMVHDVLARQIAQVSLKHLESTEDLFPLLYVESQPVQQTAFDILHKQIPTTLEQISIDSALEKTTARLPEELLSLILEAPTVSALSEANFERGVPLPLRGYLLSWLLVFDHLEHASFKVKNDYVEHIKEGEYLSGLLNFMFDFLGHAHNRPVDVSKLDITTYTSDIELPKRDVQWLLTHLYYLCLLHVPSLAKSWYIDCKSRPIAVTLEPWTEKFISPPVITAALISIQDWTTSQSNSDPDSPFTAKVSPLAREITAFYTIDEQTTSMRISLPPSFPLTNARIEGLTRVAVNEQKWQSWLRSSLGAITIFNGSLVDALTTFKRNVEGAMKGQTECAICYSIVGSDRKLPDKRCGTCRNAFHGSCLYKWFRSSGSSSCPLCRNPFSYG